MTEHADVVIVGGGLVGASLACALEPLGLRITVLESVAFANDTQPSFDDRTIAITWSSRRVLEAIGVWHEFSVDAGPIRSIHVSDRGHLGMTRLHCSTINTEALGYVIPTRSLGRPLNQRMHNSKCIRYLIPSTAVDAKLTEDAAIMELKDSPHTLTTSLLVIADGGRSALREKVGICKIEKPYRTASLVALIDSDRHHEEVAYERFTCQGPLALLPMAESRFALAWTLPKTTAEQYADLSETQLLLRLQQVFGDRAGIFQRVGNRRVYPLRRVSVEQPFAQRTVVVGNAAHEVHPVAGQGFNLGLRDVAELADAIASACENNQDIGNPTLLNSYTRSRQHQTRRVLAFTDGLVRLFSSEIPGLGLLRSVGLNTIEFLPPVKQALLRRTVGIADSQPRLARGLPLVGTEICQ